MIWSWISRLTFISMFKNPQNIYLPVFTATMQLIIDCFTAEKVAKVFIPRLQQHYNDHH